MIRVVGAMNQGAIPSHPLAQALFHLQSELILQEAPFQISGAFVVTA